LGINIPSFQLGICYMYDPVEKEDYIKVSKEDMPKRNKCIQFSHVFSMGYRETGANGGPKYAIWHTSMSAGLFISRNNRLKAGIEFDYLGHRYASTRNSGGTNNKDLHWEASRISLFLADEIMIGRFSILAQVGFYVTQNTGQPWFMSVRLSGRYYFVDPYVNPLAPFLTVTMKAHKITAEYFSAGFGLSF